MMDKKNADKVRKQLLMEKSALLDDFLMLSHKKVSPDEVARESAKIDTKLKSIEQQLEKLPKIAAIEIKKVGDIRHRISRANYAELNPQEADKFAKAVHDMSKTIARITKPEEPTTEERIRRALNRGDKSFEQLKEMLNRGDKSSEQLKEIARVSDEFLKFSLNKMIGRGEVGWFGSQGYKGMTFTKDLDAVVVKTILLKHLTSKEAEAVFRKKSGSRSVGKRRKKGRIGGR
jgi:hypothetical protein